MIIVARTVNDASNTPRQLAKRDLSAARTCLLRLMQRINFGRMESLLFRDGEPIFDPTPRLIREVKFGGENGPRAEATATDFVLKQQVVELFGFLDQEQSGVIDVLEIKHGLPFRMVVTDVTI